MNFVFAFLISILAAVLTVSAQAQTYPVKPLRMILSYPPGGSTDVLGRMMAKTLAEAWPVGVVVENRPGAGGNIGTNACVKAAPDGYTLCSVSPAQSVASRLSTTAGFDSLKDFSHVTLVTEMPLLLLVHPSLPVKNVPELVALAKRKPGALSYGSSGGGATPQLMMEMLKQKAGIDVVMITYKGTGGGQIVDQIAGRVEVAFNLSVGVIPFVKEGKLRALAISTARRLPTLAEVPTVNESGLKGVEGSSWQGIAMPAGVPRDIVHRIGAELTRALKTPEMREKILVMGGIAVGSTPEEFAAFFHAESDKWYRVATAANVKLD